MNISRRAWRWTKVIGINILLVILLLSLAEIFCRLTHYPFPETFTPSENNLARFDADLGWSYRPNLYGTVDEGGHYWPLRTDENGIRIDEEAPPLDPYRPSIVFIGCSFTVGQGLPFRETYAGRLGNFPDIRLQVVNLGVQGYGTDQSLLALKKFLPKFNAKVIVYTFIPDHILRNGNDDRRLLYPMSKFIGTKPLFALDKQGRIYLKKRATLYENYSHSYLWDATRIYLGTRLGLFPPKPTELTRRLIMAMKRESEAVGANFMVLNWRWLPEEKSEILSGLDVPIVDVLYQAPSGWEHMYDWNGHPTAQASQHIASLLNLVLHDM